MDLWKSGAFSILDLFIESQDLVSIELGAPGLPDFTGTIWDDLDGTRETSCYNLFLWNWVPGFYIASRANYLDNWDEWDLGVLCHEYGHHVMYHYMEEIPEAGGSWYYLFPTEGKDNLQLAMSEGWAHFFSAVVLGGPEFINSTVDSPLWVERNFELPIPDPPYYNNPSETDPLQPPWLAPQFEGAHIPGAVVVSLWDLYDALDDDDYYIDYVRWGHNNDHNGAEWWRGMVYVWDVLTDYDPQPANPDHDHCWNIYEFIDGWRNKGYPVNFIFTDLFAAHNVAIFEPGDVDGDGGVNVGDLAYLVCYLFQDCDEPEPLSRADVNASCSVNVGDLWPIISFLYYGGPECLVGCVDLY